MVAIGAEFVLVSRESERVVSAADFFNNDGIAYLSKLPDEILTEVRLPVVDG